MWHACFCISPCSSYIFQGFNRALLQLLREISHENVVKLANVHINHADMSLYLAFDYAEHDLYVSKFLNLDFCEPACSLTHSCFTLN